MVTRNQSIYTHRWFLNLKTWIDKYADMNLEEVSRVVRQSFFFDRDKNVYLKSIIGIIDTKLRRK